MHTCHLELCSDFYYFFFHAPATPEIYTLSLHDALPIFKMTTLGHKNAGDTVNIESNMLVKYVERILAGSRPERARRNTPLADRKSTRLNSSHPSISYAVFCLKKKKTQNKEHYSYTYTF